MDERNNKKRKKDKFLEDNIFSSTDEKGEEEDEENYAKKNKKLNTPIDLNHLNHKDEYSSIYSSTTHFGMVKSSSKTTPSLNNSLKRSLFISAQENNLLQKSNSVPSHLKKNLEEYKEFKKLEIFKNSDEDEDFSDLIAYEIDSEIGYGTFSTVYKAKSKQTGKLVAIKRIIPTCKPSRVLSEIEFIKKLK